VRGAEQRDLVGIELDQVREPDVLAQPVDALAELHRLHGVLRVHYVVVMHRLRQVRVQSQAQLARGRGGLAQLLRQHRMRRRGRRHDDAAHAVGRAVVVARGKLLDVR
jgi:hypothetical protein